MKDRRQRRSKKISTLPRFSSQDESVIAAFAERLGRVLTESALCTNPEESASVGEAIAESAATEIGEGAQGERSATAAADVVVPEENEIDAFLDRAAAALLEFFETELTSEEASRLVRASAVEVWDCAIVVTDPENGKHSPRGVDDDEKGTGGDDESVDSSADSELDGRGESDDEIIGKGECELCERAMKLTRHHLVPLKTHPRLKKRILNAAGTLTSRKDDAQIQHILGADMAGLPEDITRDTVRAYLSRVCLICRMCHSAVHRVFDHWELATKYNTVDRLLECEEIVNFCKWANKQRPSMRVTR